MIHARKVGFRKDRRFNAAYPTTRPAGYDQTVCGAAPTADDTDKENFVANFVMASEIRQLSHRADGLCSECAAALVGAIEKRKELGKR